MYQYFSSKSDPKNISSSNEPYIFITWQLQKRGAIQHHKKVQFEIFLKSWVSKLWEIKMGKKKVNWDLRIYFEFCFIFPFFKMLLLCRNFYSIYTCSNIKGFQGLLLISKPKKYSSPIEKRIVFVHTIYSLQIKLSPTTDSFNGNTILIVICCISK